MANRLYVTTLGGFSLAWPDRDGASIAADRGHTSQQVWDLLAYLCVSYPRQVEEAEMVRALWEDGRTVDPSGALKMVIQRARGLLEELGFPDGKNVLLFRRGLLSWAPGLEVCLDIREQERLCRAFAAEPGKNLSAVLDFLPRCEGEFLPGAGRLAWVSSMRTACRGRCLQLLRGAAECLGEAGRYDEAIRLCRKATEMDPYEERTQIMLMRLLHASGATQSALWHYRTVSKMYVDQLGIAPSGKMSACYQELARAGRTEEPDLLAVQKRLEEGGGLVRPMYCEYPVFRTIYHLTARSMPRAGFEAQLALLTVLERDGTLPSMSRCGAAMETLRSTGLSSLREGDVCTRFSPNQYLLLLPSAAQEDAQATLSRCLAAFEKTPIGQSVAVRTGVRPVRAIEL